MSIQTWNFLLAALNGLRAAYSGYGGDTDHLTLLHYLPGAPNYLYNAKGQRAVLSGRRRRAAGEGGMHVQVQCSRRGALMTVRTVLV